MHTVGTLWGEGSIAEMGLEAFCAKQLVMVPTSHSVEVYFTAGN